MPSCTDLWRTTHCPVDICAKFCVVFSTEEYMVEHKVIKFVFDEMPIFRAIPQYTSLYF